jgi:hypothetical protein
MKNNEVYLEIYPLDFLKSISSSFFLRRFTKEMCDIQKTEQDSTFTIITTFCPSQQKHAKRSSTYVINKQDTVLLSLFKQATDSLIMQEDPTYWEYPIKILNHKGSVSFERAANGYYLKQMYHSVIGWGKIKPELIQSVNSITAVKNKATLQKNMLKMDGFTRELHKMPSTTTENFWLEYLKE